MHLHPNQLTGLSIKNVALKGALLSTNWNKSWNTFVECVCVLPLRANITDRECLGHNSLGSIKAAADVHGFVIDIGGRCPSSNKGSELGIGGRAQKNNGEGEDEDPENHFQSDLCGRGENRSMDGRG